MNTVFFFTCGIMTIPGESKNWDGRAVTWMMTHTDCRAEKCEYWTGPISRIFGQERRVRRLYQTAGFYSPLYGGQEWHQVYVAHSNGADVVLKLMTGYPPFARIETLHLVCGATEADFDLNGLNRLLLENRIGNVVVYIAGRDAVLNIAHSWAGKLLGYGCLGLTGPVNVTRSVESRVSVVRDYPWSKYGHSSCWSDSEFDSTMSLFKIKRPEVLTPVIAPDE